MSAEKRRRSGAAARFMPRTRACLLLLLLCPASGWALNAREAVEYRELQARYDGLLRRGPRARSAEWVALAQRTRRFREGLSDERAFDDADFLSALCYAQAGASGRGKHLRRAAEELRAIAGKGGSSELAGDARLMLGKVQERRGRPAEAVDAYLELLRGHASDGAAEAALDRLGELGRRAELRPGIEKALGEFAGASEDKWLTAKARLGLPPKGGEPRSGMLERRLSAGGGSAAPEPGRRPDTQRRPELLDAKIWSAARSTRFVLAFSRETEYSQRRLENPPRLELEFKGAGVAALLRSLAIDDGLAKGIAISESGKDARVRIDLERVDEIRVFALHEPFRVLVDLEGAKKKRPPPGPPSAGPPSAARRAKTIVIDAGHGGHDPGARGPDGAAEKEINLAVARELARLLRRDPGYSVYLTRETDRFVPLDQRAAFANQRNADLFISIHCNASKNDAPSWGGIETYHLGPPRGLSAEDVARYENGRQVRDPEEISAIARRYQKALRARESRAFSELTQERLTARLGFADRGVKTAPFAVLVGAQMPAVLVELGFLTNPREAARLVQPEAQRALALGLYESVAAFTGNAAASAAR